MLAILKGGALIGLAGEILSSLIIPMPFRPMVSSGNGQGPEKPVIGEIVDAEEETFTFPYPEERREISDIVNPPVEGIAGNILHIRNKGGNNEVIRGDQDIFPYLFFGSSTKMSIRAAEPEFISLTRQPEIASSYVNLLVYSSYAASNLGFSYTPSRSYEMAPLSQELIHYEGDNPLDQSKALMPMFSERVGYHAGFDYRAGVRSTIQQKLYTYQDMTQDKTNATPIGLGFDGVKYDVVPDLNLRWNIKLDYEAPKLGMSLVKTEWPVLNINIERYENEVVVSPLSEDSYKDRKLTIPTEQLMLNLFVVPKQGKSEVRYDANSGILPGSLGFDDALLRNRIIGKLNEGFIAVENQFTAPRTLGSYNNGKGLELPSSSVRNELYALDKEQGNTLDKGFDRTNVSNGAKDAAMPEIRPTASRGEVKTYDKSELTYEPLKQLTLPANLGFDDTLLRDKFIMSLNEKVVLSEHQIAAPRTLDTYNGEGLVLPSLRNELYVLGKERGSTSDKGPNIIDVSNGAKDEVMHRIQPTYGKDSVKTYDKARLTYKPSGESTLPANLGFDDTLLRDRLTAKLDQHITETQQSDTIPGIKVPEVELPPLREELLVLDKTKDSALHNDLTLDSHFYKIGDSTFPAFQFRLNTADAGYGRTEAKYETVKWPVSLPVNLRFDGMGQGIMPNLLDNLGLTNNEVRLGLVEYTFNPYNPNLSCASLTNLNIAYYTVRVTLDPYALFDLINRGAESVYRNNARLIGILAPDTEHRTESGLDNLVRANYDNREKALLNSSNPFEYNPILSDNGPQLGIKAAQMDSVHYGGVTSEQNLEETVQKEKRLTEEKQDISEGVYSGNSAQEEAYEKSEIAGEQKTETKEPNDSPFAYLVGAVGLLVFGVGHFVGALLGKEGSGVKGKEDVLKEKPSFQYNIGLPDFSLDTQLGAYENIGALDPHALLSLQGSRTKTNYQGNTEARNTLLPNIESKPKTNLDDLVGIDYGNGRIQSSPRRTVDSHNIEYAPTVDYTDTELQPQLMQDTRNSSVISPSYNGINLEQTVDGVAEQEKELIEEKPDKEIKANVYDNNVAQEEAYEKSEIAGEQKTETKKSNDSPFAYLVGMVGAGLLAALTSPFSWILNKKSYESEANQEGVPSSQAEGELASNAYIPGTKGETNTGPRNLEADLGYSIPASATPTSLKPLDGYSVKEEGKLESKLKEEKGTTNLDGSEDALNRSKQEKSSEGCEDTSKCFAETMDWMNGEVRDTILSEEELESISQCYAEKIRNIQKARDYITQREKKNPCGGALYNCFHHVGFTEEQKEKYKLRDYVMNEKIEEGFKVVTTITVGKGIEGDYYIEAVWEDDVKSGEPGKATLKRNSAYAQLDIGLKEQGYTPVWKMMSYIDTDTGEKRSGLYLETIAETHLEAKDSLGDKDEYGMKLMGVILMINDAEPGRGTLSMENYAVKAGDRIKPVFKNDNGVYGNNIDKEAKGESFNPMLEVAGYSYNS